ncbi:MAG: hypothetical protein ACKVQC_07450, partial [Elusimicrobiota bacterium]
MISKHFLNHLKFTPLLFFFFPIIAFASNIGEEDFSTLNPTSVNRLLKLPLSYVESNSLFIKNKNVSSVGFSRGANQSSLSFDAKESLLTDGLSIRLVKSGEKNISAAVIVFKSPINISTFDSLVIWLKSNRPDSKLSFGFKDVTGKIYRSPTVPDKNLVKNKFGQLVIPFKYFQNISNKVPVSHLSIEIDSNPETKGTVIEFAGISFILQPKIIAKPMIFYPRVISPANLDQASISPVDSILEEKALGGVSFMEVETLTSPPLPPVPAPEKITPASIKKTTQQKPSFTKWLEDFFLNRQWGIIILSVLIGIGVGLYYWAIKRRYQRQSKLTLQRLLKFIHWPFVFSENDKSIKNEKDFWKGLSEENIKTCILSTDGVVINESKNENFYGETFLKRQINLAKKHNIKVIPSLSFSQTGFNYEIFLSNPNLYKITPIPLSDRGLSDEELRIKFKYHFPIWIPPFWQKKYSLPHRILVAYGIKSGAVASYDTVQLNIKSPELKTEAERLLQSFAQ